MERMSIETIRRQLGLTQAQLGELLGVTHVTVSNWERGETPVPGAVERWAELMGAVWSRVLALESYYVRRAKSLDVAGGLLPAFGAHALQLLHQVFPDAKTPRPIWLDRLVAGHLERVYRRVT